MFSGELLEQSQQPEVSSAGLSGERAKQAVLYAQEKQEMEDAAWGDHCNHTQTSNPASTVLCKAFPNAVPQGSAPPPPIHLPPQPHLTPVPTPSPSSLAPLHASVFGGIGHRSSLPSQLPSSLSHVLAPLPCSIFSHSNNSNF